MTATLALIVVGGGPAGFSAARAYREAGGAGPVAIVADEHRMPYRRPPLTKELLRGEAEEAELPLESESWLGENSIDLISGRAVALDAAQGRLTLSGGRELHYRSCVLAPGAEPTRLPVPGADHPRVRALRTLDHFRELTRRLDGGPVVVIGSGFIGCEIAASLRRRGIQVTLVSDEKQPNAARLGPEAGDEIRSWLEQEGVTLALGTAVEEIADHGEALEVRAGETHISAGLVIMATGVAPRGELAIAAGLSVTDDGAVPAGPDMETEVHGLYVAGDVAFAENATAGRRLRVEHWGDALTQGEVAGRNAAGEARRWDAVPGFWSTIGAHTLKYGAWGDGFDASRVERHGNGAFTVWYGREGALVGVLTHEADADYERGSALIARGAPWP